MEWLSLFLSCFIRQIVSITSAFPIFAVGNYTQRFHSKSPNQFLNYDAGSNKNELRCADAARR